MRRKVDLAVVGAGFAGLACARAAAARGLRAVVLERKVDPGARVRTTGILVKELVDEWDIPGRLTRKVRGVRLYSPSLRFVDLERPGYYFLATDTPALLRWLAGEAEAAGVEVLCGAEYRAARREKGSITIESADLDCSWLVGADGARSRVARDFGLGVNRRFLAGVEVELEGVRGLDDDRLHCFLDSSIAPGYIAWVVPGCGITQVGAAARLPGGPRLDEFLRRASPICDFREARIVGRRAGLIPVGGRVSPFAAANVLLAGDAAGLVSPLTAGGIHTALRSGRRAGQAIAEALLDGGPDPARALRSTYPRFAWKMLLRRALDLHPSNTLIDLLLACPPVRALARAVFFHHRGLLSAEAWRDLVRRPARAISPGRRS